MVEIGPKTPRTKDEKWLAVVRTQPCCACGTTEAIQAHHPRVGVINSETANIGMAQKSSDRWAVALCERCHFALHHEGERWFWASRGIDPHAVALNYSKPPPLNYRMP